LGLEGEDF